MEEKKIIELENQLNKVKELSGVISVYKNKENIKMYEKTFGFADIENERFNNKDTKFGIASGGKLLTAIAICQLVEQGKLEFDTFLSEFIESESFEKKVTIHQLLTHTSGIPDYFDEEIMDDFSELWTNKPMYNLKKPQDFFDLIESNKTMFKPGEKFHYNNAAYVILAYIVEKVSGLDFPEFIKKNIFDVLDMNSSGYFRMDSLPKNCAYGYEKLEDEKWKKNIYSVPIIGGGDGGVFTNAEDIFKLWDGLINNKLLNKKFTELLLEPKIYVDYNVVYYGYGIWIIKKDNNIMKYYISGEDPGVSFESAYYPNENLKMVFLGNTEIETYEIVKIMEKYFLELEFGK